MKRSKHSLSNYKLLTCEMGKLIPIGLQEVLPGDTFQQSTSALIRVSPLVAPVMHPVTVRIHHFYVPNRILWDGWEDFITGESNESPPTTTLGSSAKNGIFDYMGCPPITGVEVSQLPQFAYNKIYNEFYRDQDLAAERVMHDGSLADIAWEKDYFTTARPWPQKGEAVTISIGDRAPVTGIGLSTPHFQLTGEQVLESNGSVNYAKAAYADETNNEIMVEENPDNPGHPNIYADLASAEAVDVRDFRKAFALQRYAEARARYGSRYIEYLRYIGVKSSDARLQRPEYLGGGKQNISFSEVLQTVQDDGTRDLGDMAGHGIAAMRSNKYRRFFEEHGFVISLMSVRPKLIYTQGLHRMWSRKDKEDYYQKELEAIGQQEVLNKEVFAEGNSTTDEATFGYTDRYREYKEHPSGVTSEFRDLLDYWHMAREFPVRPALNADFIKCVPTKRIYAEQTKHPLWVTVQHSIQARRMMSKNPRSKIL